MNLERINPIFEKHKDFILQSALIILLGVLVGLTWSALDGYKSLCIAYCNDTLGPDAEPHIGLGATSCTCRVYAGYNLNFSRPGLIPNLSYLLPG